METRLSTETMATTAGLETSRAEPQTISEVYKEQQGCKDGYLKCSLKLKQMAIDKELEKVSAAR